MIALGLIVATLAVVRATRLITTDQLTDPLRHALTRRFPPTNREVVRPETGRPIPDSATITPHWIVKLAACDWCVSFWLALGAALVLHAIGLMPEWRWVGMGWWGMAGAAGLLLGWA